MQVALNRPIITGRLVFLALALFYLAFIFGGTISGAEHAMLEKDGWRIGDWLINYQGGFVRRGLAGEGIFRLAGLFSINPEIFVVTLQVSAYFMFFLFSFLLLRKERGPEAYALLWFAPFLFAFQIHDPAGGFRKEILFLALLAFVVWTARTFDQRVFERFFYGVLLVFPALILSHEMIAIWLPLLLVVYIGTLGLSRKKVLLLAALVMPSILAFAAALTYRGDPRVAAQIAFSLREAGYMNLHAAIAALANTAAEGRAITASFMARGSYLLYYPAAIGLALLAFIPVRRPLRALVGTATALVLLGVSILATGIICFVALDWGRFIYTLLASLFLLSFVSDQRPDKFLLTGSRTILISLAVLAYASLWFLPHSADANPYMFREERQ